LEAKAFESACVQQDIHGIPSWQYANGTVLFATDRPEVHLREMVSSYLDQLALVRAIASVVPESLETPEDILSYSQHSIVDRTEYGKWHSSFLADISASKKILEERESSGAFIQCKKCGSNDVDTEQKQTRSADEPMTIFCMCKRCGKRFTIS
jgi:DNA-directed RNA polymerase subunit M/transcription elongation factor TFIIS